MAELIGFLILFALLAAVVAFAAQGVLRMVGLVILAAIAVIIGVPTVQRSLPELSNFFGQRSENQAIEAAPNTVPGQDNTADTTTDTTTEQNSNDGSVTNGGGSGGASPGVTSSPRPVQTPNSALW